MKIKLKRKWMGHPIGAELTVAKTMGPRLVMQGTAVEVTGTPPVKKVEKKVAKKVVVKKEVKKAPKNKMMRSKKTK